jgi:DNA-directed RNA polymerase subunit K/omega
MTKEDLLDSKAKENGEKNAHVCQNHKTGIALREIDAGRVEVGPLLERSKDNSRC